MNDSNSDLLVARVKSGGTFSYEEFKSVVDESSKGIQEIFKYITGVLTPEKRELLRMLWHEQKNLTGLLCTIPEEDPIKELCEAAYKNSISSNGKTSDQFRLLSTLAVVYT